MPASELHFWFSLQCPYSYIGWEVLNRTIPLDKVALRLIGLEKSVIRDHLQFPGDFSPARWAKVSKRARALKVPLKAPKNPDGPLPPEPATEPQPLNDNWPEVSSEKALRALKKYAPEIQGKFLTTLFHAVFEEGLNLTDTNAVSAALTKAGLDERPFLDAQQDPETLRLVKLDEKQWHATPGPLIPELRFEDEIYAGIMDQRGMEKFFQRLPI